ncbi:MAG: CBS domain-containing protein [Bdellovibrionota bacterium]|nr:CBS domain-containing protein [Bdellovibrionota bacterium]
MKHVRNLMSPKPITCKESASLDDLLQIFLATNHKFIPIVNDSEEVVGLMDELRLVKALGDKNTDPVSVTVKHFSNLYIEPKFIEASAPLNGILPMMLNTNSNRLIVVSGSKKALGVLSPLNILRAIVGLNPKNIEAEEKMQETVDYAEKNWKGTDTKDIFFQAFESSPYMMIMTDREGKILNSNQRVEAVLGYKTEDILTKPIIFLFPEFAIKRYNQAVHTAKNLGKAPTEPTALLKKNRSYEDVDMGISAIRDDSRHIKYLSFVFRVRSGDDVHIEYIRDKKED